MVSSETRAVSLSFRELTLALPLSLSSSRSHAVDCEWPGDEGVGACSNCFFSYSLVSLEHRHPTLNLKTESESRLLASSFLLPSRLTQCETHTPPELNQPSDNSGFSLSSLTQQQQPHDGERTPTQSPRPLPGSQSSSGSSSTSFPALKLPSSSDPVRPSPQIPISFLLTEPSSASASSSSSQPTGRWASASPSSSSSASSSKTKQTDLVEGEMTELFGRVVQLQADANSSLGQVVEKLRSPPNPGSKLTEEKDLPQEGRQETEVDRPESGASGSGSGSGSASMEGLVSR